VKLLEKTNNSSLFLNGKKERELLAAILQRYPVLIASHFSERSMAGGHSESVKNHELLQEALAEQQRENKRQLEEMLCQPGRFVEDELGFKFHLSGEEVEWLLQVLNDVRVGTWVQLGEPESESYLLNTQITEQNLHLAWTMEMAGLFQHELLKALKS
jgi:hypothetical protein